MAFQMGLQQQDVGSCQFADGAYAQLMQRVYRGAPGHKQLVYRKRPHFPGDFFRKERMGFVGFFKVRGHFCEKFIGGYADVHSKAKAPVYFVLKFFCGSCGGGIEVGNSCKVQIAFVNTDLLNIRSQGVQEVHKPAAVL